jgi:predicted transcriptional regulator
MNSIAAPANATAPEANMERVKQVIIGLRPEHIRTADRLARKLGFSRSEIIRRAISRFAAFVEGRKNE